MYDELPRVHRRLVPELSELSFPTEVLSTCEDCAMQPRGREKEERICFTAPQRCCTYHPRVANFLVGQALARDDVGTQRILERLKMPDGLYPSAITWPKHLGEEYANRASDDFGRNEAWGCPYWVEGPLGCSIHRDRGAVCRTWFCKSVNGRTGWSSRRALRTVLKSVEETCAHLCVLEGAPPEPGADAEAWEAWYRWCADHVDAFDDARIEALRGDRLFGLLRDLGERIVERDEPMPSILAPSVQSWVTSESSVGMSGYSPYDLVELPPWIFGFLSKLDGQKTWREAQREVFAELGESVTDDLVLVLYRRGILSSPENLEHAIVNPDFPGLFEDEGKGE